MSSNLREPRARYQPVYCYHCKKDIAGAMMYVMDDTGWDIICKECWEEAI